MTTTTVIRRADEGDTTWFFNALMTTKASSAETGGAYSLTEHVITPASTPPMHVQVDEDEAFYILDGEVEFEVDGQVALATPGTFAFVVMSALKNHVAWPSSRSRITVVVCISAPPELNTALCSMFR